MGFSQLSGLLDLSKDVGQNHGGVIGSFADVAHLLSTQRIVGTRLGLGKSIGDPLFGVAKDGPDIVVGLWITLDVVKEAGCGRCGVRRCRRLWNKGIGRESA